MATCGRVVKLPPHRTVLLVEDDPEIRQAIAEVLQEAGRTVVCASDGLEALAKLDVVERPCLILLDLMMPRMDGIEFLRRLGKHPRSKDFPVLVLSAHGTVRQAEVYPGVLGTLRKPFDIGQLLSWVDEHC
ncbi:MAG: response regulator [Myxococcaceae bacterium]|nr:MAG: response regulator [Myxococcaceae bacterium]